MKNKDDICQVSTFEQIQWWKASRARKAYLIQSSLSCDWNLWFMQCHCRYKMQRDKEVYRDTWNNGQMEGPWAKIDKKDPCQVSCRKSIHDS